MKKVVMLVGLFFTALYAGDPGNGTGAAHDISLKNAVERLIIARKYSPLSLRIAVGAIGQDSLLINHNGDSMSNPASVTKLVTAAMAFDRLGLAYAFTTRIFIDSALTRDSVFTVRNLYIEGGGDPGFTAERLWLFVEQLWHAGIRKIRGDLVLDDFFFDSLSVGPGFEEDSTCKAYQPLINALAMNFNTVAVYCRPGASVKQPVSVALFPEMNGPKVFSSAVTALQARREQPEVETSLDSGTTCVTIRGSMGMNETGTYNYRKLWQTWESFGAALLPLFARRGIVLEGKCIHERVPRRIAGRAPFFEFSSEPLSVSINRMFKYSSNFTAELLFKTLSAQRDTVKGSWERSSAIAKTWWKERALPGTPVMQNGSGLGNTNHFSPAQIVALLSYVWNQKPFLPDYLAALSTAGLDGTLKSRFLKSKLKGAVRAKTGTLNAYGINTLAGYLLLPDRPPFAFAIFCDKTGHAQYDDWMMQEQILEKAAEMQ